MSETRQRVSRQICSDTDNSDVIDALDFETCYRAAESRDARFDGQFLIAVRTTGVYCRPTCPSRMPKAQNVVFYRAAAAAEAAGFRACRRCHPELAPDSLAESRRSQLARLLIQSTSLPLTEVAFAAGYSSVRRFNESLKTALGQAPSEFRRTASTDRGAGSMPITLRLSYRPPLDVEPLFLWLSTRALAGVEYGDGGVYARTLRLAHGHATVELKAATESSTCMLRATLTDIRDIGPAVRRCRDLLDLDCEPHSIAAALSQDRKLARLVGRRPGIRVPGCADGFELAVRAVLGQQISVAAARTFAGRLVSTWGESVQTPDERLTHLFPTPSALAEAPLEATGITRRQAGTIRSVARAVAGGELTLDPGADRIKTRERLLAIPGIGDWTASYIGMRALRDPDAFPAGDLGLRHAARQLGLPDTTIALREHSLRWRPWRAYAAMHLWASLKDPAVSVYRSASRGARPRPRPS